MKRTKKQKATKKRARKQKQAKAKRQSLPKILQRDAGLHEALNHHHPLVGCRINEGWENGMAIVVIVRQALTGYVYAAFLIDLMGVGLKDVMGDYGVTETDIDELFMLEDLQGVDLVACDYEQASNLVYAGIAWTRKWKFKPPKDYKVWMRLLEPWGNDAIDLSYFGRDGEPFLIMDGGDFDIFLDEEFDLSILSDPISVKKAGVSKDALRRLSDIKSVLIEYARREEFQEDFDAERKKRFGRKQKNVDETEWINFQDWFVLEYKNEAGEGIVDLFIKTYQDDMSHAVLALIQGWKRVLQGIFEIKETLFDGFLVKSLINERDYRVFVTNEEQPLDGLSIGDFLVGRIVPALGVHVFSGSLAIYPASKDESLRVEMYRAAAGMQTKSPKMALMDNPKKLQKSREAVQRQYEDFIDCFGHDEVLGSGKEILKQYRHFMHYQMFEKKDPQSGLTKAEEYKRKTGNILKPLKVDLPKELRRHKDAAMLCDPADSLTFLKEYGMFLDVFKHPKRHLGRFYAEDIVMGYLESDTISDVPFRRAAQRYPENFKVVISYYKNQEGFSAETLEELMQEFKPWSYEKLPGVVVILDEEITGYSRQTA